MQQKVFLICKIDIFCIYFALNNFNCRLQTSPRYQQLPTSLSPRLRRCASIWPPRRRLHAPCPPAPGPRPGPASPKHLHRRKLFDCFLCVAGKYSAFFEGGRQQPVKLHPVDIQGTKLVLAFIWCIMVADLYSNYLFLLQG